MQTTNTSFATRVLAACDKAARAVQAVWTLFKIVVVAALLIWLASWKISSDQAPEVSYAQFVSMASPLETVNQDFSIGNHSMPSLAVMAPLSEAERMANLGMTAAQLQRARWMLRTWTAVHARNEPNRQLSGASEKSFASRLVDDAMGKEAKKSNIAELSNIQVLLGNDLIPSLASGKLPVFTDADTAKWKAEASRLRLSEIDMRRAKFFQVKYGVNMMPAKVPDDLEIRAEEKLAQDASNGVNRGYYRPRIQTSPLSDNERLELAVGVLNTLAAPVAAAPVK